LAQVANIVRPRRAGGVVIRVVDVGSSAMNYAAAAAAASWRGVSNLWALYLFRIITARSFQTTSRYIYKRDSDGKRWDTI